MGCLKPALYGLGAVGILLAGFVIWCTQSAGDVNLDSETALTVALVWMTMLGLWLTISIERGRLGRKSRVAAIAVGAAGWEAIHWGAVGTPVLKAGLSVVGPCATVYNNGPSTMYDTTLSLNEEHEMSLGDIPPGQNRSIMQDEALNDTGAAYETAGARVKCQMGLYGRQDGLYEVPLRP